MKTMWLFIPVVATIIAVGVVVAGVAQAQENPAAGTSVVNDFATRVAAILGIDSAQVQSAMDQARKDMKDTALKQRMDGLVASGRLTQAQANEYLAWYNSRPAGMPGFEGKGFGGHGRHFKHHGEGAGAQFRFHVAPPQAAPTAGVAQ